MTSDETARLRRTLKALCERLETVVYAMPQTWPRGELERIAREAREAVAESAPAPTLAPRRLAR